MASTNVPEISYSGPDGPTAEGEPDADVGPKMTECHWVDRFGVGFPRHSRLRPYFGAQAAGGAG